MVPILLSLIWLIFGIFLDKALGGVISKSLHRVFASLKYLWRHTWRRDVTDEQLITALKDLCRPNPDTCRVMQKAGIQSPLAFDGCFEILRSHRWRGWSPDDIEIEWGKFAALPEDLQRVVVQNPPDPPNNPKYGVCELTPESSERPMVQIRLAPTDYFSTVPIQHRVYDPILTDADGVCSPWEKYGDNVSDFEHCRLPNIVCVHVVVVLPGPKLLIGQRVKRKNVEWEHGVWCVSFEEQMNAGVLRISDWTRPPDRTLFDTIRAGLSEELGCDDTEGQDSLITDMKILSLVMDSVALNVDPIGLVRLEHCDLKEIQARKELRARDNEFVRLAQIDLTIETLAPILYGCSTEIGTEKILADNWHLSSRMRMLVALFHYYGFEKTMAGLTAWKKMNLPQVVAVPVFP